MTSASPRAERRDAGAWADHDHRRAGVGRQTKGMHLLHEYRRVAPRAQVLREEARAGAVVGSIVLLVAQHANSEVHLIRVLLLRGGDRVQPRLDVPDIALVKIGTPVFVRVPLLWWT